LGARLIPGPLQVLGPQLITIPSHSNPVYIRKTSPQTGHSKQTHKAASNGLQDTTGNITRKHKYFTHIYSKMFKRFKDNVFIYVSLFFKHVNKETVQ
jgi:hypothetical protein